MALTGVTDATKVPRDIILSAPRIVTDNSPDPPEPASRAAG
jgi:hypothetical protein